MKKETGKRIVCMAVFFLVALCVTGCGVASGDLTTDRTSTDISASDTADAQTQEPFTQIVDKSDASADFLSNLSAEFEAYATWETDHDKETAQSAYDFGAPLYAFSENGHAMVIQQVDGGMQQSYYQIWFTADYGETWYTYRDCLHILGYLSELLTDGTVFWALGEAQVVFDLFYLPLTDHMTQMPAEQHYLADDVKAVLPEAEYGQLAFKTAQCEMASHSLTVEVTVTSDATQKLLGVVSLQYDRDQTLLQATIVG